jgi:hypothetical protein
MVTDVTDGRLGGSCSDKVTVTIPSISLVDFILSALCSLLCPSELDSRTPYLSDEVLLEHWSPAGRC